MAGASFHALRLRSPPGQTTGGPISTELRINDRIRVPEVRLVGPNGETVGIVPTERVATAPTAPEDRKPRRRSENLDEDV
jgi:hypothetical protein